MSIVDNLAFENKVSVEMGRIVSESMINNKHKFKSYGIESLQPYIKKDLYVKLHKEIYADFTKIFKFFELIDFETMHYFKEYVVFNNDTVC